MATAQQVDAGGGADRITDLPDDVLHSILARLPSTAEAARTSVLSRRWRRVWTGVPSLSFRYDEAPPSSLAQQDQIDGIDAALSGHAATTVVERLEIDVPYGVPDVYVSRWLRFASRRLNGELRLALPSKTGMWDEAKEAAIPLCERITSMSLCLDRKLRLPLHSDGAFTALVTLELTEGFVDGGELESTLSSRCPHLKKLSLDRVRVVVFLTPAGGGDLCIRSDSLEQLKIIAISHLRDVILKVATPELQSFSVDVCCKVHIIAPKLSDLYWNCSSYDPERHLLKEFPCYLRSLRVATDAVAIMRRFDTVHELNLAVSICGGPFYYERFLEDINHLAKCEVLVLKYSLVQHAFKLTMLNILSKCTGVRKLVIDCPVDITDKHSYEFWSEWGCQCEWPKILKIDNAALSSLKQVEIMHTGGYDDALSKLEALMELFCACIGHFRKTVPITIIEN